MDDILIGVAIIQMQEVVGPGLVCVYPPDLSVDTLTVLGINLVELLLPQGSSNSEEDTLRIVTRELPRPSDTPASLTRFSEGVVAAVAAINAAPSSPLNRGGGNIPVFIAGAFRASRLAEGCRGTRQATVCLLMRFPLFTDMLKPLGDAAALYADGRAEGPELCFALYDALRHASGRVSIAGIPGKQYDIRAVAAEDSVYKMLKRESDLMSVLSHGGAIALPVWRAIAQHRSVVIVADTAEQCTRFVLGCVALVAPMKLPLEALCLYASTPSMVEEGRGGEKKEFLVLGTTNEYFGVKKELGDVIVNISTKEVWIRPEAERYVTPASNDTDMFERLENGIKDGKGEEWARLVLERHTTLFLQSLPFLEALLQREQVRRLRHLSPEQVKMVIFSVCFVLIGIVLIIAMLAEYA